MTSVKIWHNPRCSKSRQGMQYLNEKKCDLDIYEYMQEKIDPEELARVIKMSDHPLDDFIRKGEAEYKELGLANKDLTVEEFAKIASEHPRLLQRPIVLKDDKAIIARPTEKIDEIL